MDRKSLPEGFSQNHKLPIRIVSREFGHLSEEAVARHDHSSPLAYYFLMFILEGSARYIVDDATMEVGPHELVFSLPNQIQQPLDKAPGTEYYKIGFDEGCLSRLPKQYAFLFNPLHHQKVSFSGSSVMRLRSIFEMLLELLRTPDTDAEIILAHLNSLLTEINAAYFVAGHRPAEAKLDKFLGFKMFVENNLTEHPAIRVIAEQLAVSTDSLYLIVKQFSGLSPKEFITNRLIVEARRRLHYGKRRSVKELAFELGFNDPDYFSRLFKKVTGKTVGAFFRDLS